MNKVARSTSDSNNRRVFFKITIVRGYSAKVFYMYFPFYCTEY